MGRVFIGLQETRIVSPNDLHLFHVVRYDFLALPVVSLDMDSTYQETPEFDYLGHKDLLKHHRVLHFALLRPQSAPDGVSKYLSCIRDEGSAISNPCFRVPHEFLPKQQEDLQAFLYSRKDITPNCDSLKGILKRDRESDYWVA